MTIKKAIDRLIWRFTSGKQFTPNEDDVAHLNRVLQWINDAKDEKIKENQGFAKLYITVFVWQLEKYQATPMNDFVQKDIHRMLDKPLDYFIKRATEKINEIESNNFLKELAKEAGVEVKHPALTSDEEKEKQMEALQKLLEVEGNKERFLSVAWKPEDVEHNLMAMVGEALINYKL